MKRRVFLAAIALPAVPVPEPVTKTPERNRGWILATRDGVCGDDILVGREEHIEMTELL